MKSAENKLTDVNEDNTHTPRYWQNNDDNTKSEVLTD